ncbi:hypothetical protein CDEST_03746 [Colletotrichum destructivum]|uniref:Uncharacterized protein n=1 Tax=Colletotrichum destructivum TaxID=34406 RepID=A0AAX4I5S2_9PEZI|nr:hypothetical protein CDEST_03746 [Colletotrichum destructivum]
MNNTPPPLESREPELLCFALHCFVVLPLTGWLLQQQSNQRGFSAHHGNCPRQVSWLSCEYHRHRHFLDPRPSTDHSSDNPDTHPALPRDRQGLTTGQTYLAATPPCLPHSICESPSPQN